MNYYQQENIMQEGGRLHQPGDDDDVCSFLEMREKKRYCYIYVTVYL
jgi:hypothetical protein